MEIAHTLQELRERSQWPAFLDNQLQNVIEAAIVNRKQPYTRLGLCGGSTYETADFDPNSEVAALFRFLASKYSNWKPRYYDSDFCWYAQIL